MIRTMIKKSLIISVLWCGINVILGFIALITGFGNPGGYIRPVNPFWIFIFTYSFYFLATIIHLSLHKKKKVNKWLSAFSGVICVYLLIIIPLILDDDYFESLDWRVPVFLIVQTALLVLFDYMVERWLFKRRRGKVTQ